MNESVAQLVDMVKNVAPIVWEAAYRQVWVDAVETLLSMSLCVFFITWGVRWLRRKWDDDDFEDHPAKFLLPVGIGFLIISAFCFLIGFVDDLANPTFQALKQLGDIVHK